MTVCKLKVSFLFFFSVICLVRSGRCIAGIELVSETTEEDKALTEGVKPDLVQGIEFAYTLPAVDLVVMSHTRTHTSVVSFSTLVDFCLHL